MADQRASILLELRQEGVSEIAAIQAKIGELMTQAKGWISLRQEDAISLDKYLEGMKLYEKVIGALATTYGRLTEARDKDATAAAKQQERDAKEAQAQIDRAEEVWRRQSLAIEKAEEKRDAAATRQLERGAKDAQAQIDQAEEVWRRQSLAIDKAEEKRNIAAEKESSAWIRANAKWLEDNDAAVAHYLANLLKEEGATEATAVKGGQARARENAKWLEDNDAAVARYIVSQNTATQSATSGYHNVGFAILSIGNALQDLQYGFGAVVNNLPLIVMGMGGTMGLAGAAIAAGTALNAFGEDFQHLGVQLGVLTDIGARATTSLEGLKEKLAYLETKRFKVAMDYSEIEEAKQRLKELKGLQDAFEQGSKTPTEHYMGKRAKAEIGEEIGAGDLAAAFEQQDILDQVDMTPQGTRDDIAWAEKAAALAEKAWNAQPTAISAIARDQANAYLAKLRARAETEKKEFYKGRAGGVLLGHAPDLAAAQAMIKKRPDLIPSEDARRGIAGLPSDWRSQKAAYEADREAEEDMAEFGRVQAELESSNRTAKQNRQRKEKEAKRDAHNAGMQSAREHDQEQTDKAKEMDKVTKAGAGLDEHLLRQREHAEKWHQDPRRMKHVEDARQRAEIEEELTGDFGVAPVMARRAAPKIQQMVGQGYDPYAAAFETIQSLQHEYMQNAANLDDGMALVHHRNRQNTANWNAQKTRKRSMMSTFPSSPPSG